MATDPTETEIPFERIGADDAQYLGDPDVVRTLVAGFVSAILDRADDPEAVDPGAATAADATELGLIFTGQAQGFTPVGAWNGEPLAKWLKAKLADAITDENSPTPADAVAHAFAVLGLEVYDLIEDLADDGDEETAKGRGEGLVQDWTDLMLGIPTPDDNAAMIAAAAPAQPEADETEADAA